MTTDLRDQFAMAALTGLIAGGTPDTVFVHVAKYAYEIADAMILARAPRREPTVDDLDLSVRAANILESAGIRTIAELKKHNMKSLRTVLVVPAKTAKEIFAKLERSGL